MADSDGQIRIGLAVDYSSVAPATAATATSVESLRDRVVAASKVMVEAEAEFGKAAALGNQQAAAALRIYEQELESAKSALASFSVSEGEVTESIDAETQALKNNVSARMAASAELRVLEGNLMGSTRAAGAFLSQLPLIGEAMQAAFPVFGAIALVAIIGKGVEAVGNLIRAFHNLQGAETDAGTAAILAGEKILSVKASRGLSMDAVARTVEGLPSNQDVTIQNASSALKQIGYQRQLADIAAQNNEQGLKGKELEAQKLKDLQQEEGFAKAAAGQTQVLIDGYTKLLSARTTVQQEVVTKNRTIESTQSFKTITDPNQIKEIQDQLRTAVAAKEQFEQDAKVAQAKAPGVQNKEDRTVEKDPAIAQLKGIEEAYALQNDAKTKLTGHGLTAGEAAQFWDAYLTTFKEKSAQAVKVSNEFAKAQGEMHKQLQEQIKKSTKDDNEDSQGEGSRAQTEGAAGMNKMMSNINQTGDAWIHYHELVAQGTAIQHNETVALQLSANAAREQSGQITKLAAIHNEAAIRAKDYADQLKVLRAELETKQSQAATTINPASGEKTYTDPKQASDIQDLQNKITQIVATADEKRADLNNRAAQQMMAVYKKATDTVNSDFISGMNQWMTTNKTFGASMEDAAKKMAVAFIDALIKMQLQHLETMIMINVQNSAGNAANMAQQKTANAESVIGDAKTAAANSYKWASAWGGPVAGAIAAAIAFTGVMAFEQGGVVPGQVGMGVPILAHAGEAVLPQPLTRLLTDTAANGGGSSSGGHTFVSHYAPQISVLDSKGLEGFTQRAGTHIATQVRKQARRSNQTM